MQQLNITLLNWRGGTTLHTLKAMLDVLKGTHCNAQPGIFHKSSQISSCAQKACVVWWLHTATAQNSKPMHGFWHYQKMKHVNQLILRLYATMEEQLYSACTSYPNCLEGRRLLAHFSISGRETSYLGLITAHLFRRPLR